MNSYLVIEAKLETALDRRVPGDKTCWEDQGLGRSLFSSKKEHREDVRFWKLTTKYPVEHKYQATCYLLVGKIPWRRDQLPTPVFLGFHGGSDHKEFACNMEDLGSIPGLGGSPGEGNGYPLHCSCLENSMDRGAWQATVHGVAKSQKQLSDFHTMKTIINEITAYILL